MGMTGRQILWQVELPLAMSVIVTGVRVAMVIAIGVTTIAAAVGAGGLGVYIFRGLRQYDNNLLLAGALPAALMALAADFTLGLLEKRFAVSGRRKAGAQKWKRFVLAAIVLGIVALRLYRVAQFSFGAICDRRSRCSRLKRFHRVSNSR